MIVENIKYCRNINIPEILIDNKNEVERASRKISKKEIYKIYKQTRIIKDVIQKTIENKCQYLSSDFNSRIHLKHWLKNQPTAEAQKYCNKYYTE